MLIAIDHDFSRTGARVVVRRHAESVGAAGTNRQQIILPQSQLQSLGTIFLGIGRSRVVRGNGKLPKGIPRGNPPAYPMTPKAYP